MLKKSSIALALVVSLSSCSMLASKALDILGAPDTGLSVDANVSKGDAEGDDSIAQNGNTNVSAGLTQKRDVAYSGPVERVINNEGLGVWELGLIVLLAGWAIPSPSEMAKGMARLLPFRSKRKRLKPRR